jgi:hypothetical protein
MGIIIPRPRLKSIPRYHQLRVEQLIPKLWIGCSSDPGDATLRQRPLQQSPDGCAAPLFFMQAAGDGSSSPVKTLTVQALVQGGFLSPLGLDQWPGGTIYGCLAHFADVGPWNELFVQDFEAGPYLIYRPVPFKAVVAISSIRHLPSELRAIRMASR